MKNEVKIDSLDFYVGTYTIQESSGIYKYRLNENGILENVGLAATTENPSFLCRSNDGKYIVAVNEISNENGVGQMESFLIKNDSLLFISKSTTGGSHPCYVAINNDGFIVTANYTGGNLGLLKLNKNGNLSEVLDIKQHHGHGTTERQKDPHAHSAVFLQVEDNIVSADLGTNELWFYELDSKQQKLIQSKQSKLKMPQGAGPRHLAIHPNNKWLYVVNELNSTVSQVILNEDSVYELSNSFSTLPSEYNEDNYCADIHLSSDGRFIYASNRGHNSIVIFEVDQYNGLLNLIGHVSTKGKWPRNFALTPNGSFLLVANQHSNNIVSFKRDKTTGLLEYAAQIQAPTPVCILF